MKKEIKLPPVDQSLIFYEGDMSSRSLEEVKIKGLPPVDPSLIMYDTDFEPTLKETVTEVIEGILNFVDKAEKLIGKVVHPGKTQK